MGKKIIEKNKGNFPVSWPNVFLDRAKPGGDHPIRISLHVAASRANLAGRVWAIHGDEPVFRWFDGVCKQRSVPVF